MFTSELFDLRLARDAAARKTVYLQRRERRYIQYACHSRCRTVNRGKFGCCRPTTLRANCSVPAAGIKSYLAVARGGIAGTGVEPAGGCVRVRVARIETGHRRRGCPQR